LKYKCKKCNGTGINEEAVEDWFYEKFYNEKTKDDPNYFNNTFEVSYGLEFKNYMRENIPKIHFVEDDGVYCTDCKGTGKVDWVTNIIQGKED
jgi:hypothetical protein